MTAVAILDYMPHTSLTNVFKKKWYFGYRLHDHCLDILQVSSRPVECQ